MAGDGDGDGGGVFFIRHDTGALSALRVCVSRTQVEVSWRPIRPTLRIFYQAAEPIADALHAHSINYSYYYYY